MAGKKTSPSIETVRFQKNGLGANPARETKPLIDTADLAAGFCESGRQEHPTALFTWGRYGIMLTVSGLGRACRLTTI